MNYKWVGAILIIFGCGGFGLSLAAAHRREETLLRQLISALDMMASELSYRLTPLPDLCRQAGREARGCIQRVFLALARELDDQLAPDVAGCMRVAILEVPDMPQRIVSILTELGNSMGRFDLDGQLKGLEAARTQCRRQLDELNSNRDVRLRSYQTLGFCAGAAIAILFI